MTLPTLFLLLVSAALLPAAPYGLSFPSPKGSNFTENLSSLRGFPTWESIEPSFGKTDFSAADKLIAAAKENGTEITGVLHQLAPWASSGNNANAFPLANRKAWADYVTAAVTRYPSITHWDVLDSFNTGSIQTNTPYHYGEILTAARTAAKAVNPGALIGFSLANYDLAFLDAAIRDGAGGQFDYLSLAPYHFAPGSAQHFTTILPTIRKLLASHDLPEDMPVQITLTGADDDLLTAAPLATSLGFDKIFLVTSPETLSVIPTEAPALPEPPDYSGKDSVSLVLAEINNSQGIIQPDPSTTPWDSELKAARLHVSATPPVLRTSFLTAPSFLTPDDREIEISVTVSRIPSETGTTNTTGLALIYESVHGTITSPDWWPVPGENKSHTHVWKITDAKFTGKLGWNFLFDASGAGHDVLIHEVKVSK